MVCPVPALTTGLQVAGCTVGGDAAEGDTCTYTCMTGYSINGASMVTCGSDGMFSPAIPNCDGKGIRKSIAFLNWRYFSLALCFGYIFRTI